VSSSQRGSWRPSCRFWAMLYLFPVSVSMAVSRFHCLIGIKAGSHWTIKDVSIDTGSRAQMRRQPISSPELQKVQSHQKVRCKP